MKRGIGLLLAGMLFFCCTACQMRPVDAGRLRIVATVFPQYDFAREIAGEYAEIELLVSAGQEMHNYEPSPLDVAEISRCDLFLRIGGESEVWTDTLLRSLDTSEMTVVTLMDVIETPLAEEEHDHHHHHHGEEGEHEEEEAFDEHIWNSPVNAIAMAEAVRDALCEADPAHRTVYETRAGQYLEQLAALDAQYRELAEEAEDPVLIVADKFPFRYLAAEYGFHYAAAFSGCSSETEPTVGSLTELAVEAKEHGLDTVLYLEFSSDKIAERISAMTGAVPAMLHPCHTVSKEDMQSGVTFLELMQENYMVIKEALT